MIKPAKHSTPARTSLKVLERRVRYIADPDHGNHAAKLVLPSKNHNCSGQGASDFMQAVREGIGRYQSRREGRRGKRTRRIWEEYCYSSPEGSVPKADGSGMEPCLNPDECAEAERRFLAGPLGRGSCRHGWHIDLVTGRCDWHCLAGEHDSRGVIWANDGFGKGQKNLKLELERIEEALLAALNRRRLPHQQIKSARQRNKEKRCKAGKLTFAQKLLAAKWEGAPETLTEAAELAGYVVHAQTEKSITVHSKGYKQKEKVIRYSITTLTQNWATEKAKSLRRMPSWRDARDVTGPEV